MRRRPCRAPQIRAVRPRDVRTRRRRSRVATLRPRVCRSAALTVSSTPAPLLDAAADWLLAGKTVATAALHRSVRGIARCPAGAIGGVAGRDVHAAVVPRAGRFAGGTAGVAAGLDGAAPGFVLG